MAAIANKNKEDILFKKQAVTACLDLSSADATRQSEALSDLERRLQATEDVVKGVRLSVTGVEDSVRIQLDEIRKR